MSGIEELRAESNERWAQATRRAQGMADHGLGQALKTYYTLYFPAGLVVLTGLGTAAGMLAFGAAAAEWPDYLAFGWLLAALGVPVGGLIYNARKVRPAAEVGNISVLLSLQTHEQKHVRRQILGKAPIVEAHLAAARGAAVQQRKGLATQLLLAPMLMLVFAAQSVPGRSPLWWLMAVFLAAQLVVCALMVREFRQTGRFLARTAEDVAGRNH